MPDPACDDEPAAWQRRDDPPAFAAGVRMSTSPASTSVGTSGRGGGAGRLPASGQGRQYRPVP